jgi:hypothetical protein
VLVERVNRLGDAVAPVRRIQPIDDSASVLNGWSNFYVASANAGTSNGLLRTLRQTVRHYSTQVRGLGVYG